MMLGMKKSLWFILAVMAVSASCSKQEAGDRVMSELVGEEIVLYVDDGFKVDTKTTEITTVPTSLYWGATKGKVGNKSNASTPGESIKWSPRSASVSSGTLATGEVQTPTPTAYNYYVANQNFTITAATTTVAGSVTLAVSGNGTDIIAGKVTATSSATPSISLKHVFARVGTLTLNAPTGHTLSGVSWSIIGKSSINGTAGTYNLTSESWTAASTKLTTAQTITSSSNLYLIPGTYTVSVTYTISKGTDFSQTVTKTADVTLVQGKRNNITGLASVTATDINLSLSVTGWTDNAIGTTQDPVIF